MDERRKYVRIPETSHILYEIIPGDKMKEASTRDISEGGIRFSVSEFIPKDSQLKIKITFQKTLFTFEALVKVVWIRELPFDGRYETGVKFIDVPQKASRYLMYYIKAFLEENNKREETD